MASGDGSADISTRPEATNRRNVSPRKCTDRSKRSASAWATVDFPAAMMPVITNKRGSGSIGRALQTTHRHRRVRWSYRFRSSPAACFLCTAWRDTSSDIAICSHTNPSLRARLTKTASRLSSWARSPTSRRSSASTPLGGSSFVPIAVFALMLSTLVDKRGFSPSGLAGPRFSSRGEEVMSSVARSTARRDGDRRR